MICLDIYGSGYSPEKAKRRKELIAHYIAKGCSERKAEWVARRRMQRGTRSQRRRAKRKRARWGL